MADTLSKLAKPAGRDPSEDASRPRRGLRPGQDVRSRPEGPVRADARLQAALRGRADAACSAACRSAASTTRSRASPPRSTWATSTVFAAGAKVDEAALRSSGLVKGRYDRIKILGNGELTKAVTVSAHAFSKSAAEKIEKAGGKVVLLGGRPSSSAARARSAERQPCPPSPPSPTSGRSPSFAGASCSRSGCWRSTASASSSRSPASTGP